MRRIKVVAFAIQQLSEAYRFGERVASELTGQWTFFILCNCTWNNVKKEPALSAGPHHLT